MPDVTTTHRRELAQQFESKKAKLAELRRARQERRGYLDSQRDSGSSTPTTVQPPARSRTDVESLVADLLSPSAPGSSGPASAGGSSSRVASPGPSSTAAATLSQRPLGSSVRVVSGGTTSGESATKRSPAGTAAPEQPVAPEPPTGSPLVSLPAFTSSSLDLFEIAPPPKPIYNRSVQTSASDVPASPPEALASNARNDIDEAELTARIRADLEAELAKVNKALEEEQRLLEEERLRGLGREELEGVFSAPEFGGWLEGASKIVQRALSDGYDYLRDYTMSGGGDADDAEGKRVKNVCSFFDQRWSSHRSVTDVDWSPRYPELSVASYNKNPASINEPDGVVCVWNLHLLERPEYVFHSQSDVLSISFSPFDPNHIIGGTYSGQILLWDTRLRSLPVLKTPLSASGHTHPIFSLSLVGTQNAHNLVSASTDGTVCAWQLDMLARPQETLELLNVGGGGKTDEVSVTCMGFPDGESATFWVGTEEGNVYAANRYDRAGAKAGLVGGEVYKGHSGPVMGVDYHPVAGAVDFSDLFLTCGVDWTVKLWRSRGGTGVSKTAPPTDHHHTRPPGSSAAAAAAQAAATVHPVYSFEEADDYVFDVRWHPVHPALFGSVDGSGKFNLWNLNIDTEVPIVSTSVNEAASRGLNKLAWDGREGKRAAIGGSDGKLYIYDIGDLAAPKESEWEAMRKTFAVMLGTGSRAGF